MAVSNQQILDFLTTNPGLTDAQIVTAMETYGISPAQMATAVGLPEGQVAARVGAVLPPNEAKLLGDTYVQAVNQVIGSGMDQQVGGLENVITYKATDNKVGGDVNFYSPTGEFQQTTKQQEVNATKDFVKFLAGSAALFGGIGGGFDSLFGGPAAGNGAFLGEGVASGVPAFDAAFTSAGGVFNPAFGLPIGNGAFLGEGVLSGVPAFDAALANATVGATGLTAAQIAALTAQDLAIGGGALAGTAPATIPGLLTPAATTAATALTPTALTPAATATTLPAATATIPAATAAATAAATGLTTTQVADLVKTGLTTAQIANLFSAGATTAAGLLQQQTSREAAQKAQAMIDAETAAAKAAAQFRPIGMTTRFGASQFGFDPKTGQLTSAGYTLSPEAKAAQDRFVKLAESGIQQAEGAQKAFEPLQLGAQSLFKLGQGYLAKSPEQVAQDYLKNQMSLLQPSREIELANLQTKLRNQGRIGLSVAQGGDLGATTPELQALFNARARQEAELAANAQLAGQRDVLFGAGLYDLGTKSLGNYYAGQQASYAPYTTALGQVQGLEQLAQQPLTMGANLGQTAAQAGFNVGQLGLRGAGASVELATGKAATTNPYSTAISGLAANPAFGQYVGGLLSPTAPVTAMSAPATSFGTGNYYGNQDLMSTFG